MNRIDVDGPLSVTVTDSGDGDAIAPGEALKMFKQLRVDRNIENARRSGPGGAFDAKCHYVYGTGRISSGRPVVVDFGEAPGCLHRRWGWRLMERRKLMTTLRRKVFSALAGISQGGFRSG